MLCCLSCMNTVYRYMQALLVMSHEPMSCLTQCLLGSIEEEDDWGSQVDVSIGSEGPSSFQHHSHRCCAIRCTCQTSLLIHAMPFAAAGVCTLAFVPRVVHLVNVRSRKFYWHAVLMTVWVGSETVAQRICMASS